MPSQLSLVLRIYVHTTSVRRYIYIHLAVYFPLLWYYYHHYILYFYLKKGTGVVLGHVWSESCWGSNGEEIIGLHWLASPTKHLNIISSFYIMLCTQSNSTKWNSLSAPSPSSPSYHARNNPKELIISFFLISLKFLSTESTRTCPMRPYINLIAYPKMNYYDLLASMKQSNSSSAYETWKDTPDRFI